MYRPNSFSPSKYIIGVFDDKQEAIQRQKDFCGLQYKHANPEGVIRGFVQQTERVTFLRKYNQGDMLEQP